MKSLHAEPELLVSLAGLDGATHGRDGAAEADAGAEAKIEQRRADTLLATIAWSRLAEPGDGVAGAMLAAFGASAALEMLVRGTTAAKLQRALSEPRTGGLEGVIEGTAADAVARGAVSGAGTEITVRGAAEALKRWLPRLDRAETVADIERACAAGLRVLLPGDPQWPVALDDLGSHAPNLLWVRGDARSLSLPALSVVGARAASGYGAHVTAEIVDGVCAAGLAVISGAAYGVDAVAHRTALAAGTPTVAVLAGGADRVYPRAHEALLDRISGAGAVCAEMVPGSAPTRWRFLQRNRLIAALSGATLVTEAGINSGSLNTAGHAAQLGRMIGAVPGPVTSAASAGCHKLLREYGAMLVTNAREACELAGVNDELAIFGPETGEDRDGAWERRVLDALPLRGAREPSDVAKRAGLTAEQAHGVLAELELLGRVRRHDQPGGAPPRWALAK